MQSWASVVSANSNKPVEKSTKPVRQIQSNYKNQSQLTPKEPLKENKSLIQNTRRKNNSNQSNKTIIKIILYNLHDNTVYLNKDNTLLTKNIDLSKIKDELMEILDWLNLFRVNINLTELHINEIENSIYLIMINISDENKIYNSNWKPLNTIENILIKKSKEIIDDMISSKLQKYIRNALCRPGDFLEDPTKSPEKRIKYLDYAINPPNNLPNEISTGAMICNLSNKKILLIRPKINGYNESRFYEFPKGHVEYNETECETMVRETREETGIDLNKINYNVIGRNEEIILDVKKTYVTISPSNVNRIYVYYIVVINENNDELLKTIPDETEIVEANWFHIDETKRKLQNSKLLSVLNYGLERIHNLYDLLLNYKTGINEETILIQSQVLIPEDKFRPTKFNKYDNEYNNVNHVNFNIKYNEIKQNSSFDIGKIIVSIVSRDEACFGLLPDDPDIIHNTPIKKIISRALINNYMTFGKETLSHIYGLLPNHYKVLDNIIDEMLRQNIDILSRIPVDTINNNIHYQKIKTNPKHIFTIDNLLIFDGTFYENLFNAYVVKFSNQEYVTILADMIKDQQNDEKFYCIVYMYCLYAIKHFKKNREYNLVTQIFEICMSTIDFNSFFTGELSQFFASDVSIFNAIKDKIKYEYPFIEKLDYQEKLFYELTYQTLQSSSECYDIVEKNFILYRRKDFIVFLQTVANKNPHIFTKIDHKLNIYMNLVQDKLELKPNEQQYSEFYQYLIGNLEVFINNIMGENIKILNHIPSGINKCNKNNNVKLSKEFKMRKKLFYRSQTKSYKKDVQKGGNVEFKCSNQPNENNWIRQWIDHLVIEKKLSAQDGKNFINTTVYNQIDTNINANDLDDMIDIDDQQYAEFENQFNIFGEEDFLDDNMNDSRKENLDNDINSSEVDEVDEVDTESEENDSLKSYDDIIEEITEEDVNEQINNFQTKEIFHDNIFIDIKNKRPNEKLFKIYEEIIKKILENNVNLYEHMTKYHSNCEISKFVISNDVRLLKFTSVQLKLNHHFAQYAVQTNGLSLEYLPKKNLKKIEEVKQIIRQEKLKLKECFARKFAVQPMYMNLGKNKKKDKIELFDNYKTKNWYRLPHQRMLKHMKEFRKKNRLGKRAYRNSRNIALNAILQNGLALQYCVPAKPINYPLYQSIDEKSTETIPMIIDKDGNVSRNVTMELPTLKYITRIDKKTNKIATKYHEDIDRRNNEKFVRLAIESNPRALQYAGKYIKKDRDELGKDIINEKDMKTDKLIVKFAISLDPSIYLDENCIVGEMRNDRNIINYTLTECIIRLDKYIVKKLEIDKDIIKYTLIQHDSDISMRFKIHKDVLQKILPETNKSLIDGSFDSTTFTNLFKTVISKILSEIDLSIFIDETLDNNVIIKLFPYIPIKKLIYEKRDILSQMITNIPALFCLINKNIYPKIPEIVDKAITLNGNNLVNINPEHFDLSRYIDLIKKAIQCTPDAFCYIKFEHLIGKMIDNSDSDDINELYKKTYGYEISNDSMELEMYDILGNSEYYKDKNIYKLHHEFMNCNNYMLTINLDNDEDSFIENKIIIKNDVEYIGHENFIRELFEINPYIYFQMNKYYVDLIGLTIEEKHVIRCPELYNFCSRDLKVNIDIINNVLSKNGLLLQFVPEESKNADNIALAVQNNPESITYANESGNIETYEYAITNLMRDNIIFNDIINYESDGIKTIKKIFENKRFSEINVKKIMMIIVENSKMFNELFKYLIVNPIGGKRFFINEIESPMKEHYKPIIDNIKSNKQIIRDFTLNKPLLYSATKHLFLNEINNHIKQLKGEKNQQKIDAIQQKIKELNEIYISFTIDIINRDQNVIKHISLNDIDTKNGRKIYKRLMSHVLSIDGLMLQHVKNNFQYDIELIRIAFENNPESIKFIPTNLYFKGPNDILYVSINIIDVIFNRKIFNEEQIELLDDKNIFSKKIYKMTIIDKNNFIVEYPTNPVITKNINIENLAVLMPKSNMPDFNDINLSNQNYRLFVDELINTKPENQRTKLYKILDENILRYIREIRKKKINDMRSDMTIEEQRNIGILKEKKSKFNKKKYNKKENAKKVIIKKNSEKEIEKIRPLNRELKGGSINKFSNLVNICGSTLINMKSLFAN
jgi:8-oxo-dGTP pyrophosphatase MutT (NUDIX family)